MNQIELIQYLESLSWTKQESRIYITLLQLGPQPASAVASHLNKNRITIYHALERLAEKKIVESSLGRNVVIYHAKAPELLLQQLNDKKYQTLNNMSAEIETLKWLLPELKALEIEDSIRPQVQLFHGNEALKSIYQLSFETSEMLGYYAPWPAGVDPELAITDEWHTRERIKRNIPARVIIPGTQEGVIYAHTAVALRESIVVNSHILPFEDVTIITDTRILMFSLKDLLGISIKSSYLAQKQKAIFNLAWEGAKLLAEKNQN